MLLLAGCASGPERRSAASADAAVARIADEMTPAGRIFDVSGASLVSEDVHEPDVVAMSWSGSSGDQQADGARVLLRVHIAAADPPTTTVFGPDGSTAALTRCYPVAIRTWRYYDTSEITDADCPTTPPPCCGTPATPRTRPGSQGPRSPRP